MFVNSVVLSYYRGQVSAVLVEQVPVIPAALPLILRKRCLSMTDRGEAMVSECVGEWRGIWGVAPVVSSQYWVCTLEA